MRLKILLIVLLFSVTVLDAQAQLCLLTFPGSSVCTGSNCTILIDIRPEGVARLLRDTRYGSNLAINFGGNGVFDLGDNGKINFGISGGFEAVLDENSAPVCQTFTSGLRSYSVQMGAGGWLVFSGNNRMEFKQSNGFALGNGSKIEGRLDIDSPGAVGIFATGGDTAMPNVDIDAENGISLTVDGDLEIGDLRNEGTTSANSGILINADGDVETGMVNTNDDFSVTAGGDINIETIGNAGSISLTISPPTAGVITIGGRQTTDNPVFCGPPDDCNDFEIDNGGGSGSIDCYTPSSDPNVDRPDDCPGGGATGPGFVLLCMLALYRTYRTRRFGILNRWQCSPPPGRSV
jgi:hypothetical protein